MKSGYLFIETHHERPGFVRLGLMDTLAGDTPDASMPKRLRYVARFNDSEAALMHAHELLKRRLLDADSRLYRVPLEQAIAAAESLDLRHQRVFIDPGISDAEHDLIDQLTGQFRSRRQRRDRAFELVGYLALTLLLFNMLFLSFS